ncbi:MAG: type I 3-dehydroquinate dehydratase [Phycisphaeraceae bacterium]|nr:type I 3-dehydroquinate dehydratase [Phycisphaeraceae bacterium]
MNLVAVAIPVDDESEIEAALAAAQSAVTDGARLVEWRVDAMVDRLLPNDASAALMAVERLCRESPAPSVVTIRSAREGGEFRGEDRDRLSLLQAIGASDAPPLYIDVEEETFERSANLRQKVRLAVDHERQPRGLTTSLILSAHDFNGRPAALQRRLATMAAEPACAVMKVAWRARSLRDNLEAFELLRDRPRPMVALCMGEFGLMSRVLAPKFGGLFTFARGATTPETAAGQPTVRELFERWRYGRIGAATEVYGVIGWPVGHSRSPDLHNAGFDAIGADAIHLPMPIEGSWESFKATVGAMIDLAPLDFRGASVTLPHKEHLVRFVREHGGTLCPLSEASGSANTLLVRRADAGAERAPAGDLSKQARATPDSPGLSGRPHLEAVNTDAPAAVAALEAVRPLREARVALLGAGGVARSVALGLLHAGAAVTLFNRSAARAESLLEALSSVAPGDARSRLSMGGTLEALGTRGAGENFTVVVNCTSVGLVGGDAAGASPVPSNFTMGPGMIVMDTVYRPRETPLLRTARASGAIAIDGSEMFIRQAEAQFRLWTGRAPPEGLFRSVFERGASEP